MDQVAVDIDEGLAVVPLDDLVPLPDLLEEGERPRGALAAHSAASFLPARAAISRSPAPGSRKRSRKGSHSSAPTRRNLSRMLTFMSGWRRVDLTSASTASKAEIAVWKSMPGRIA